MGESKIPEDVKWQMMGIAKKYSSDSNGGITINNPDKYKYFRDGQDSGYTLSQSKIEELEKEVGRLKGLTKRIIPFAEQLCTKCLPDDYDLTVYDEINKFKSENNL